MLKARQLQGTGRPGPHRVHRNKQNHRDPETLGTSETLGLRELAADVWTVEGTPPFSWTLEQEGTPLLGG